jgi:nitrile hydratase accessory protein
MSPSSGANSDLSPLPRNEEGPVFNEPWEAHAFALAVCLSEAGRFSWPEWSALLGQEIQTPPEPDKSGSSYYLHWLSALEQLCVKRGLVSGADLNRRKEEWRQSYLHTPHGQPVELTLACKKTKPADDSDSAQR